MSREYLAVELVRRVRQDAGNRCGYCLSPQHLVMARLEIEHVVPLSRGGTNDESNLWLSCPLCNRHKGDRLSAIDPETGGEVPLFHPRRQRWAEHFRWSEDGLRIVGLTPAGRATVVALQLDTDPDALVVRSYWVLAGWHPPTEL
ncbi:HNH endonuclease signature motif containing protein [Tautonia sp. JC769]|uniref:HNH endonuclease n=1 Tax=Tautonia sp. JC769 TaxID=3232135 RepID=UPI003459AE43